MNPLRLQVSSEDNFFKDVQVNVGEFVYIQTAYASLVFPEFAE